jgi:hypothetical protein
MTMFAYRLPSINSWNGWMTESRYLEELAEEAKAEASSSSVSKYEALRSKAFELARNVGWEGDIREGPFIAGIPTDTPGDDGYIMIAWKQDNNDTTFVVSPFNLPWLENV